VGADGRASIPVALLADSLREDQEVLTLALDNGQASESVLVNDTTSALPVLSITADPATVSEGGKGGQTPITFTVSLSKDATSTVTVGYAATAGTALAGTDFLSKTGSLNFNAGETSKTITVTVLGDEQIEPDEAFSVVLSKPNGAEFPGHASSLSATATIQNDDLRPALSIQDTRIDEGNGGSNTFKLTVNLSKKADQEVAFTVSTADGSAKAGSDYKALPETVVKIPAGKASVEVPLTIISDTLSEDDENFTVTLSKPNNADLANGLDRLSARITIGNDDYPTLSIGNVKEAEGDLGLKEAKVKVTLSAPAVSDVTVHYQTQADTARQEENIAGKPNDYVGAEDDLIIYKGQKEGFIPISIVGDTTPEADETFHLVLSNPTRASFAGGAASLASTITITNDDQLPTLMVVKNTEEYEGGEGETTEMSIKLMLSKTAADPISIHYQTQGNTATEDGDYRGQSGDLTFLAGQQEATLTLSILGDSEPENTEEFFLKLSDPKGVTFDKGQLTQEITLTLFDDDTYPSLALGGTPGDDTLDARSDAQTGGRGNDSLDGGPGADKMIGGEGNDTYYVDNPKDQIIEQDQAIEGTSDLAHSTASSYALPANVEDLIIDGKDPGKQLNATGNELDNTLTGNIAMNALSGGAGDDRIDGMAGRDTLTGGDGADLFSFSTGIKDGKNVDAIKDFAPGEDKLYLSAKIFEGLANALGIDPNADEPQQLSGHEDFFITANKTPQPLDSNDFLLYDSSTGRLYYDDDGSGSSSNPAWFATLTGKPALSVDDIWIV
jgi:Ca2+-binding RTX toxin-like protein